jgi:tRNA(fMet)-specific endonuclease VapC
MSSPLYLLDTNILIHFARGDRVWDGLRQTHNPLIRDPKPLLCSVTSGELWSFAYQFEWGGRKRSQVKFGLEYFIQISIQDPQIIQQYALIDSHFKRRGMKFGKNDLWIAATASAMGAVLLTTDRDFDAMDPLFLIRERIDPTPDRG